MCVAYLLFVNFKVFASIIIWRTASSSCIFFFMQETAYEMRISDWSSDVCSSDLIPFLQHFRAGNAVADDVIDRGADRLRERRTSAAAAVVQRCRDAVQRADDVLVADAVQLVGGNARFDVGFEHDQHGCRSGTGFTHLLLLFGSSDRNGNNASVPTCVRKSTRLNSSQ